MTSKTAQRDIYPQWPLRTMGIDELFLAPTLDGAKEAMQSGGSIMLIAVAAVSIEQHEFQDGEVNLDRDLFAEVRATAIVCSEECNVLKVREYTPERFDILVRCTNDYTMGVRSLLVKLLRLNKKWVSVDGESAFVYPSPRWVGKHQFSLYW